MYIALVIIKTFRQHILPLVHQIFFVYNIIAINGLF